MSAAPRTEPGVHRLLDIVVEEVSLVDRAANKHRFLIVKRSNDMDETKTGAADETAEVEDLAETAGDEETEETGDTTAAESSAEAAPGTPLAVALAALEGLTEAVEVLATAGGAGGHERLAALAGDVRAAAEQLASLVGNAGGTDAASPPAGGKDDGAAADAGGPDPLAAAIAAVRTTLAQVRSLVEAGWKDAARPATPASPAASPAPERAPASAAEAAAAGLATLAEQVRALAEAVKAQQQRLARLEKRFGLPNSAPAGERTGRGEDDEDVSWPLDLNRGLDRESVDKAVSFHDA